MTVTTTFRGLTDINPQDAKSGDTIWVTNEEGEPARSFVVTRVKPMSAGAAVLYREPAFDGDMPFTLARAGRRLLRQEWLTCVDCKCRYAAHASLSASMCGPCHKEFLDLDRAWARRMDV